MPAFMVRSLTSLMWTNRCAYTVTVVIVIVVIVVIVIIVVIGAIVAIVVSVNIIVLVALRLLVAPWSMFVTLRQCYHGVTILSCTMLVSSWRTLARAVANSTPSAVFDCG